MSDNKKDKITFITVLIITLLVLGYIGYMIKSDNIIPAELIQCIFG